jgi:cerevisin
VIFQEFTHVVPDGEHLRTFRAIWSKFLPHNDESGDTSHSTCTADKAVGKTYGSSKGANLVVVQARDLSMHEFTRALQLVAFDIRLRNSRVKKSVVTCSILWDNPTQPDTENIKQLNELKKAIKDLFNLDVPVFFPAGNFAEDPARANVDTLPALWAESNFPLVVVGSTSKNGRKSAFSQGGPKVTVYAMGEDNACVNKESFYPDIKIGGTSVACPQVAGLIANLLSYDIVPFDTRDGKIARSVWGYLQTNAASWPRDPNAPSVRMIWNGVTEQDNPPFVPAS